MSSQSPNCSWTHRSFNKSSWGENFADAGPHLTANPDVAGTGASIIRSCEEEVLPNSEKVLIGFVGSGYMCWIILLLYYLAVYNPYQAGFSWHVNPVDAWIFGWFSRWRGNYSFKWGDGLEKVRRMKRFCLLSEVRILTLTINKCVLLLSDQQIVTGIAILGSAYSQLDQSFSLYHWQMSIWLAYFSSATHLGTLSVLRNYLRQYPVLRTLRLFSMLILAIMLIVSLLPTGSPLWLYSSGAPTDCYFNSLAPSWKAPDWGLPRNNGFLAVSTITIVAYGYLTRFIKIFPSASMWTRTHLRVKPGKQVKRGLDTLLTIVELVGPKWSHWTILVFYNPFLVVFLMAKVVFDLIESMLWEVGARA
jgi:hypothetical protein